MRELLLGCGSRRRKLMKRQDEGFDELTTLDINPNHKPDVVWDLESDTPLPFDADYFDEIHAYEVLEHIGQQGDYRKFFAQFSDYWRVLKPGGHLCASTPTWNGLWAWGDPSHKRIINEGTLVFLSQLEYQKQWGKTPMSDFRHLYRADFNITICERRGDSLFWVIEAVKPSRWVAPS